MKYLKILIRYSTIMSFLKTSACSCGADSRADCFGTIQSTTVATCRADPGVQSTCEGVVVANNTFGTNSSATVKVDIVSGSSFVDAGTSTDPGSKATLADVASFAVVKYNNAVIGQLIGNGKAISTSASIVNPLSICLDVNPSIPQANADFPVPDVIQLDGSKLSAPLNLTVSLMGTSLCAQITQTGTYFPVIRMAKFNVAAGGGGNTVDTTTTTTTTTTITKGSNNNGGTTTPNGDTTTTQNNNDGDGKKATSTVTKLPTKLPSSATTIGFNLMIIMVILMSLLTF